MRSFHLLTHTIRALKNHPVTRLALALLIVASLLFWLSLHRSQPTLRLLAELPGGTMAAPGSAPAPAPPEAQTRARVSEAFGKLPLYFVENRGEMDERVAYYVQGRDKTLYFTAEGLTFALTRQRERRTAAETMLQPAALRSAHWRGEQECKAPPERYTLKLDFIGANPAVRPQGQDQTEAVISFFKGRPEQWQAGLKTYAGVVYHDLWPGIDLVYSGTVNRLKYRFVVRPGADPAQIKLAYRGASGLRLNPAGQLEVETPVGGFEDERPESYQEVGGERVAVASGYRLEGRGAGGGESYGFAVGDYDRSRELVIDPAVLIYAGYIGGSGNDQGNGIAVDSAGNAYITGITSSNQSSFPVTVGPDLTFNGNSDAFVAKVNAAGTALLYCGYIGGSGEDRGFGIAVDSAGNAYVTGSTESSQASFPVTVGPDLTFNGNLDAFVAKVNAAGTALLYCGYIGGSGFDLGFGIAVDSVGNAYVTGSTESSEASFPNGMGFASLSPAIPGPDQTANGVVDAFVAKVNAAGTALLYAGYIGGSGDDSGNGIAVDSAGNAYVTGTVAFNSTGFPVTVGPDLIFNGGTDAFVAKVNAAGTALLYCGYIGGSGFDDGFGIAVDSAGNAYVTGRTESDQTSFPNGMGFTSLSPPIPGPDQTYNGGQDAFVAKVGTPSPPSISKTFGVSTIPLSGTTSLSFTLTNPNATVALTSVAFTDLLPTGLIVASPPNLSGSCGGTVTAVSGSGTISLSGGMIAAGGSCTFSVDVTGTTPGTKSNTTGPVTSAESGTGATSNTATLTVGPTLGPGTGLADATPLSDQKAGSVLVYNFYSSSASNPNLENTRLNLTNANPTQPVSIHLFFVDGSNCGVADFSLCLTPNQTLSFLASDLDPGVSGYLVVVAVAPLTGCPVSFNYLIGDEFIKLAAGQAANLGAEAFAALAGGLPFCDANSVTATLNFDGVSYNQMARVLAVSSLSSPSDGNATLLVINRVSGNFTTGASQLGTLFGVLYDDLEQGSSFNLSGGCQLRGVLSNSFPRTTPRFGEVIPSGRSGWLKLWAAEDAGILGAVINFNPQTASHPGAFGQGHNLHKLTLTSAASLTIPIFSQACH